LEVFHVYFDRPQQSRQNCPAANRELAAQRVPQNLYTVRGYTGTSDDPDADRTPSVIVEHIHPQGGEEQAPVLIVEVSDAPVSDETAEEAGRYAAAGVRDYWVIEIGTRRLHVYRDPRPEPDAKHGAAYKQVRIYSQNALVAPLAAEIHLAQVINLLPW
jgi:Uma2 family endonuclease